MAENNKFSIGAELTKAAEKYKGSTALMGKTMLTEFNYNNGSRNIMFTSHLGQFVNLVNPEHPGVRTTGENVVGKYSSGYLKLKHDTVLYKRINKYNDIVDTPLVSKVFLYDKEKKKYTVKTIQQCENLTEHYGYEYDNGEIDSYHEGETIPAGTVIYKSKSYDEFMNYGYGVNMPILYTTDPRTHEDGCIVSETAAKELLKSTEVETVTVGVNMNDILLNIYGNNKKYKVFPNVGEYIENGVLCCKRTLIGDQTLYDFKNDSLSNPNTLDQHYYSKGKIIDIDVYCNNQDLECTPFNKQICKYLEHETAYYQEIYDTCESIINSGKDYSRDVDYLYKQAIDFLDTDKKWKEKDSSFNNIQLRITVMREVEAYNGQKITGRSGNKSVISTILPDDQMPYYYDDNGNKVTIHLMKNILEIINRTIAFPLFEISINFICNKVRCKLSTLKTLKEKETLLFSIIKDLSVEQYENQYKIYKSLNTTEKKEFIQSCIDERIFIDWFPMWEDEPMFFKLQKIYHKYNFLTPYDIYINKWGREIKCLSTSYVGEMYIMKLKQSAKKNYSVRSTGGINSKSLPDRNHKNKAHMSRNSDTPIRLGEFETINFVISAEPSNYMLLQLLYRTSEGARRDFSKLLTKNKFSLDSLYLELKNKYISRTGELFTVLLKSLGLGIEFIYEDDERVKSLDDKQLKEFVYNGETYLATEYSMELIKQQKMAMEEVATELPIADKDEFNTAILNCIANRKRIIGPDDSVDLRTVPEFNLDGKPSTGDPIYYKNLSIDIK